MSDIVERLNAVRCEGVEDICFEAADEITRLRDIEAAYELNQKNSYRAIMMWEEAHSKRASGIHEVELLTWLLDEVERLRETIKTAVDVIENYDREVITCTVWLSSNETLVDYLRAAKGGKR